MNLKCNNCGNKEEFNTKVLMIEEWVVDNKGNFLSVLDSQLLKETREYICLNCDKKVTTQ